MNEVISTNSDGSTNDANNHYLLVGGAVGGVFVGILLLLVAVIVFVVCTVRLKRSRKGRTITEESSTYVVTEITLYNGQSMELFISHPLISDHL